MKLNRSPEVTTVLFDLGGVLVADMYDHIVFDRHYGLAPRGWLVRRRWRKAAVELWAASAIDHKAEESLFWQTLSQRVGAPIDLEDVTTATKRTLHISHESSWLLPALKAQGMRIGLISDNTPFWYNRQIMALGSASSIDRALIFLSYERELTKLTGLYDIAAKTVDPARTLVVEDRPPCRAAARRAGFRVASYQLASHRSLAAVLRRHGLAIPSAIDTKH